MSEMQVPEENPEDEGTWSEDGVLTLKSAYYDDPERVFNALLLVGDVAVTEGEVAGWTSENRKLAAEWAIASYTQANDNEGVKVPKRPWFVRRDDGQQPLYFGKNPRSLLRLVPKEPLPTQEELEAAHNALLKDMLKTPITYSVHITHFWDQFEGAHKMNLYLKDVADPDQLTQRQRIAYDLRRAADLVESETFVQTTESVDEVNAKLPCENVPG